MDYEKIHSVVGKKVIAIAPALNQFIIYFNDGSSLDIQTDDEPMKWEVADGEDETQYELAKKTINSWPEWKKEFYFKLLHITT